VVDWPDRHNSVIFLSEERDMAGNRQAAKLRNLLARGEFILAPGIYDGISARVADRMGFHALYMTGYGATASMLGLPDAGLATYSDMLGRAEMICSVVETPLIADADTGYGGLLNVQRTIRGYETAGVAAIQIEDQEMPKKCGHTPGRRVVPAEDMALKIRVAADARRHEETLIVARTDARTALGLDEALRRARLYEEAGADIIFVESPESEAELERIGKEVSKPLLANMVEFGKTPRAEVDRLKKWGFDLAIYPVLGLSVAAEAMRLSFAHLKDSGTSVGDPLPQYQDIHGLMGFPEVLGDMNGKQFLELLARLPARVWIQAILGLIGFIVLAVLGFAVIAGVAAVGLVLLLAFKAKRWILSFFRRDIEPAPPARHHDGNVTDVQFEIVDRSNDRTPRP
jgi:2-methylisocitrate lyase-like PEP mutase family enzyme